MRKKAEVLHRSLFVLRASFLAGTAILLSCSGSNHAPRDEKVPVTVAVAAQKNIPVQIRTIGSVQPISTVAVRALVTGELTGVSFREGDDVRKGQPLFGIDPRPFQAALSQAEANLARDEALLENSQSDAARYADLVKKDYVTREEYENRTSAAKAARAVVAADRAAADTVRLQLSYCDIRSPIDGRTGSLMAHAGNIVRPTDANPLVVINQIAPVYVQFAVPESQLATLRSHGGLGVPVAAMHQGGGAPIASGRLSFIDNAVDTTTGTITLKAVFSNGNRALWPGQFVAVAVTLQERPKAVVVPSQAVQNGQSGQYVYVVRKDRSVEMRPVSVAESVDQESIIASGVEVGETVVTDGQIRLTAGSKVDVKNAL